MHSKSKTILAFRRSEARDDEQLVVAALEGDQTALEGLYRRHISEMRQLAFQIVFHESDAEDIVQDTFITAFDKLAALKDRAAFKAWLTRILVNSARGLLRRRRLRQRLGLDSSDPPPSIGAWIRPGAPPDVVLEVRAVCAILGKLPTDVRIALVLKRIEGCTIPEISERMGLSTATVKRRLKRGEVLLAKHTRDAGGTS